MKRYAPLLCAAVVCLSPLAAIAQARPEPEAAQPVQDTAYDPPAHVALVEGAASLERDGRTDPAPSSMPLLAGDRVRTQVGRVEVLFADGSTLHFDHQTTIDFQSDDVVRLLSGRVRLSIPAAARDVNYRIDAPGAWVEISDPGEYRIALVRDDEIELAVFRGAADLVNEDGRTRLSAGERAFARADAAPSRAYVFNSAAWDAFDRWSEGRRDERLGLSTQYLPNEVRTYASTFDRYGNWRHEPSYGYVWYPSVHAAWRPYHHGRWASLRPYGWTWIGSDPWGWPTHHYGRWGFSAGAWFWIPGRHWGPAWVSWAYAPGYVSWCPLGWNNRAVFSFNFYGGHRHHFDHWKAWTVVPRHHFGRSFVHANAVNVARLDNRVRSAFVARSRAPGISGYAVPRSAMPIRTAGTPVQRAVPRGTAPGSNGITAGSDSGATRADRATVPFRSQRPDVSTTGPGFPARSRSTSERSAVPSLRTEVSPERNASGAGREGGVTPRRQDGASDGFGRRAVPRSPGATVDPGTVRNAPERTPGRGVPVARPRAQAPEDRGVPVARPRAQAPDDRGIPVARPRAQAPEDRGIPVARPRAQAPEDRGMNRVRPESPRSAPSAHTPAYQPREMPSVVPSMPDGRRAVPRGGEASSPYRSAPPARMQQPEPPRSYSAPRAEPRSSPPARMEHSAPPPPPSRQAEPAGRSRGSEGASSRAVQRPRGN